MDTFVDDPILGLITGMSTPAATKFHAGSVSDLESEPTCFQDVKSSPYRALWEEATTYELDGLRVANAPSLLTKTTDGKTVGAK